MGLDSFLYMRGKTPAGKIINSLDNKPRDIQLGYWRKRWDIHSLFCSYSTLDKNLTDFNCEEIILTKDNLLDILKIIKEKDFEKDTSLIAGMSEKLLSEIIEKALNEIDFEHEEIFYYFCRFRALTIFLNFSGMITSKKPRHFVYRQRLGLVNNLLTPQ